MLEENYTLQTGNMRSQSRGLLQVEVAMYSASVRTTRLVLQRRLTLTYHQISWQRLCGVEVVVLSETCYLGGKQRMALVYYVACFSDQLHVLKNYEPHLHLRLAEIHFDFSTSNRFWHKH